VNSRTLGGELSDFLRRVASAFGVSVSDSVVAGRRGPDGTDPARACLQVRVGLWRGALFFFVEAAIATEHLFFLFSVESTLLFRFWKGVMLTSDELTVNLAIFDACI
jgi:hypothetical protein